MGARVVLTKPERLNCFLFVSSDAKPSQHQFQKQCQYIKQAVPHSLITIARFATDFITAGQDMHFSAWSLASDA